MKYKSIYDLKTPFDFDDEAKRLFVEAMRESFSSHYDGSPFFKTLCLNADFDISKIKKMGDIYDIPYIFVNSFKELEILSIPEEKIKLELTSSGTSGQRSRIVLDDISLKRILKIVKNIYGALGMVDDNTPVNYICFTYDPRVAKNVGTAFSDKVLTGFAPKKEVYYAIQYDKAKNDFFLNEKGVKAQILKYSKDRKTPVRIIGFPAFIHKILTEMRAELGKDFKFSEKSFVMTGGGWKGQQDKEIPKMEFKKEIGAILGIPPENIRDLFGMVEHGIPYVECECSNMHIPIYSVAVIRDPLTMNIMGYGKPGILHLYTPYINSVPSISLLCTDKAVLHKDCPCGRKGDFIELLGRGGTTKHKGCAIHANELLTKKADK